MKTILLIEDDPFLVDIYSTKLKEAGFKVDVVENGEDALLKIRQKNTGISKDVLWPDLLVLDIVLAKVDGWQVLEQIKKDEKLRNLKIIVFTNLGQKEEVAKGLALGATKYLIKAHYTPAQLIEEIKKILE